MINVPIVEESGLVSVLSLPRAKNIKMLFFCFFLYGQVPTVEEIMSNIKQENRWNRWMLPEGMQYAIVECVAWCRIVKERFLCQLNVIKRNAAEDYVSPEMAPFYNGIVRAVPYKDVSRWGSRSKM